MRRLLKPRNLRVELIEGAVEVQRLVVELLCVALGVGTHRLGHLKSLLLGADLRKLLLQVERGAGHCSGCYKTQNFLW